MDYQAQYYHQEHVSFVIRAVILVIVGFLVLQLRSMWRQRRQDAKAVSAAQSVDTVRECASSAANNVQQDRKPVPDVRRLAPQQAAIATARFIVPGRFGFVLFRHGTLVVVDGAEVDPAAAGLRVIDHHGPFMPGGPGGDFAVHALDFDLGHLVSSANDRLVTLVMPGQLGIAAPTDLEIGLYGRGMRGLDAQERIIVHVAAPTETA